MNYKIITNESNLLKFINWLPELKSGEIYYVCLLARNKYCKEVANIKSDKMQLKRFTSDKERLLLKIQQLECSLGTYESRGTIIPQEALALYININPRCMIKATKQSLLKLVDLATREYNGFNPHQEVMSEIQKSVGTKHYVDFDFDTDDISVLDIIYQYVNEDATKVLITRGGFHLLVDPKLIEVQYKNTWYNNIRNLESCDVCMDNMVPIPGTYQGGFSPYFK